MADQQVGKLNVVVGLDNTGFQNGITEINRSLRVVQSEFQAAAAKIGNFGSSTEGLKLKTDSLSKQIELQKQKVEALQQAYNKSAETKGTDARATQELEIKLNKAMQTISKMEGDLKSTTKQLKEQSTILGKLGKDYSEAFDQAKNSMGNAFDKIKTLGTALTGIGVGLGTALGGALKTTADFDAQMSKVQALSGSTAEEFNQLRQEAIKLGADTSFSASQAASGMQMLAAGGMNANQIMEAMPGVLSAAAASGEEMALVADTMSAALNGFGLEASQSGHVADVLATAANASAIGVKDMADSFKYIAPVAHSLGISMEEVSAGVIEMGNAGIKGEQAGTTMREALLRLVDPPKEASKELDALGVSIKDSSGKMLPLGDIIGQLNDKMDGMNQTQKAAALSTIFGINAVSGMMVLIDQGKKKFDDYTDSLKNSDGASQKAADTMKNNLKGSMEQLSGSIEAMAISIGTALSPAIKKIADFMTDLVNKFNELSPATQSTIAIAGAIAAAFALITGPLLVLIGLIPSIMAGFAALTPITAALSVAFNSLTWPISLTILAIAALGVAAYELYKHWDTVVSSLTNLITTAWDKIKSFTIEVWDAVKTKVVEAFQWMYDHNYYFQELVDFIVDVWNKVKTSTIEIWTTVSSWLSELWAKITIQVSSSWNAIYGTISSVWTKIKTGFNELVTSAENWGKNLLDMFISGIKSKISSLWDTLKSVTDTVTSFLGFHSPSKMLPDSDEWAPNFMDMFTKGIQDNIPKLKVALNDVAVQMGMLNPNSLQTTQPSNTNYFGGNTTTVYIQANNVDDLMRELYRRGVRFS